MKKILLAVAILVAVTALGTAAFATEVDFSGNNGLLSNGTVLFNFNVTSPGHATDAIGGAPVLFTTAGVVQNGATGTTTIGAVGPSGPGQFVGSGLIHNLSQVSELNLGALGIPGLSGYSYSFSLTQTVSSDSYSTGMSQILKGANQWVQAGNAFDIKYNFNFFSATKLASLDLTKLTQSMQSGNGSFGTLSLPAPEPSSLALLAPGLLFVGGFLRRKIKS